MPSDDPPVFNISSVAIIGAGPSGLAAATYVLAEDHFDRVDVFEQKSTVGGVWNYDRTNKAPSAPIPLPQLSPDLDVNAGRAPDDSVSPLYDNLETNIPSELMGYSDLDWPKNAHLFPKHETVTDYLNQYADRVRHLIRFNTTVLTVELKASNTNSNPSWIVTTSNASGEKVSEEYGAVVVANGHYNVPFLPDYPGLQDWASRYPGTVSHSMFYRSPKDYLNKKVLIVGNSASGVDIAAQILPSCAQPILCSARSESYLSLAPRPERRDLPAIDSFRPCPSSRAVRFVDGTVESDIDGVIFCTGYLYSAPFLRNLPVPFLRGEGTYVAPLWKHLLYAPAPTLAFSTVLCRVIPFPLAEVQASVLARMWSGRLACPSREVMEADAQDAVEKASRVRDVHLMKFPGDADYINDMYDLAMTATDPEKGKRPPRWSERDYWLRERFPAIKRAYNERGLGRHKVQSLEELGFDYEAWKKEQGDGAHEVNGKLEVNGKVGPKTNGVAVPL